MNSQNTAASFQSEGYLGSMILYFFISVLFFYLGRNFDRVKEQLSKAKALQKRPSKYSEYQKVKRRKDDEETSSIPLVHTSKTAKEKYLEKNLEESKNEIKSLSSELARLRQKEQNFSAENQILKSKLMIQGNEDQIPSTSRSEHISNWEAEVAHRSGTAENPILDRFEESKEDDSLLSRSHIDKDKKEAPILDFDEDEDVVNEIDTFLIEDEDL